MDSLFALLLIASFGLLVIGFFSPKTSLFWDKKSQTKGKSILVYGGLTVLFFVLFGAVAKKNSTGSTKDSASTKGISEFNEANITASQRDSIRKIEKQKLLEEIKKNSITAQDLTTAYEENEVNADIKYKGKNFYVTGDIADIKKDLFGKIYVALDGAKTFRRVQYYFNDEQTASTLKKGMNVTFKGTCDGLLFFVKMKKCVLIDKP